MTGGISLGRIVAEITANTAGLRRGAADAERILNDTSNNASAAGKAIGVAFAVTAALGVMKLIDKLEDCTQVAIDNKKALMGLESVAKAYGVSVEDATKATKDFTNDGLLQMKSATTGMKNILSTGFNVSEAMKLSQALKDIGAFNSVTNDLGQAYEDVTKGMRTGSIELIENIGLTQKLSAVMKNAQEQAKASGDTERARQLDISNGIDLTNNAAQREAFYNMVLKEGEKFKGNAAELAENQASSQAKANAAMKEAADAIGNRLLPAYSGLMDVITKVSKATSEYIKGSELDKVTSSYYKQREELNYLSEAYFKLKDNLNKTTTEQEMYLEVINKLKTLYPDYLKNINLENVSNGTALNLLQQINSNLETKYLLMAKEAAMNDNMAKAAKYREAERKQLEEINRLETDKKTGKPANLGIILAGGYDEAIKNAKNLATIYKKNANEALDAANKAGEYWQLQIERVSGKNVSFKEPEWLVKMKQDIKKQQDTTNARQNNVIPDKKTKVKITPKIEITDPEPSWIEVQNLIYGQFAKFKPEINYTINREDAMKSAQDAADLYATQYLEKYKSAQDAADIYAKQFIDQYKGSDLEKLMEHFNNPQFEEVDGTYINKTLEDVTKSFSELAGVLNNDVIDALSSVINEAMSMSSSINGFSAAQMAGDTLGMLSGGIGIFSSAVNIFSSISSLFSDSTYNFDEAVEKMLKGIREKTPTGQVAEYEKIKKLQDFYSKYGITESNQVNMWQNGKIKDEFKNISAEAAALSKELGVGSILYNTGSRVGMSQSGQEMLANLEKIIPQLAEQLSTTASDFGSAIGSALSSATTSEELKANLYDSIYGTVKSGLINAFIAGEVMKPLLDNLQQTVTLAVASGGIDDTEKAAIQALMGEVGIKTDEFYSALEAVGLNVVDAAGQLNEAANRMDNVNRNLRLADRISTITTQTGTIGIPPLLSGGSVVYDFSNANLGGMTEQQVISAVSKAKRMASIKKVGV